MSFNEKLQKLRKENKYSQEELADMLDVTRQSVSKWESGQTYPEMDKLLALCKIFNCSLDELTNDEIKEISNDKKTNFNSLVDSSLAFINKTYKVLSNMTFKNLLKCILTMFVLAIVLAFLFIPFSILQRAFYNVFFAAGSNALAQFLYAIVNIILGCIFVALYIMLFVYIFKIAFLDKYEFISTNETTKKIIKDDKEIKILDVDQKEEIQLKQRKDTDYPIFKTLGAIIMFFVKMFLFLFAMPYIGFLVLLFTLLVIIIYLAFQGVFFFSSILFIIFGTAGSLLALEFIANILFNRKHSYNRMITTFIVTIAGFGLFVGVLLLELNTFKYHNEVPPSAVLVRENQEFNFNPEMLIHFNHYFDRYEVDESLTNTVIIVLEYYEEFYELRITNFGNDLHIVPTIRNFDRFRQSLDLIVESLRTREIYNYDLLFRGRVIIRSSSENIELIKSNIEAHWAEINEREKERQFYQIRINELYDQIRYLEDEQFRNEEEKENLRFQILELQNELQDLRERAQSILN